MPEEVAEVLEAEYAGAALRRAGGRSYRPVGIGIEIERRVQHSAGLLDIPHAELTAVAFHVDVDVVFERKLHGIFGSQLDLSIPDQIRQSFLPSASKDRRAGWCSSRGRCG